MRFAESMRHWLRTQSSLGEFNALDQTTVGELARDNAIPEGDFHRLATRDSTNIELLRRLLARVGIDLQELARAEPGVERDMAIVCSGCAMARRCRRDLNREDATAHYQQYCPNAQTIDALRAGSMPF